MTLDLGLSFLGGRPLYLWGHWCPLWDCLVPNKVGACGAALGTCGKVSHAQGGAVCLERPWVLAQPLLSSLSDGVQAQVL